MTQPPTNIYDQQRRNLARTKMFMAGFVLFLVFLGWGVVKKVKVYEVCVEGAKEGFTVAIKIIPYLVAMLVAIGIFRASQFSVTSCFVSNIFPTTVPT